MSKYKMVSYMFILLGVLLFAGTAYLLITYFSGVLGAIVNFVTTNDYTKLQQCGVTPPPEFDKLKNEFATVILPALYLGPIALFVVLSAIMFLAGSYYHRGKMEDEADKHEKLEREMVHKIVNKMDQERPPSQPSSVQSRKRRVVEKVVEEEPSGRYREVQTEEETREGQPEEEEEPEESEEEEPPRKRR